MEHDKVSFEQYNAAADYIRSKIPAELVPEIGIVCGSGLGGLADTLEQPTVTINYGEIPGFAVSTAEGHAGELVFGKMSGKSVVCMKGRFHCYEGYSVHKATFPIRVMKLLGVRIVIATNAAGGLNPNYKVGDVMLLSDHLSPPGWAGKSALIGPNIQQFGVRFPAVSDAYTPRLREIMAEIWLTDKHLKEERKLVLHEGVYGWVYGPSYETRVECRALRGMGVDVVGMSTVPEVVIAKHCGMEVLAMTLVTNEGVMDQEPSSIDIVQARLNGKPLERKVEVFANHAEVLEAGRMRTQDMQYMVREFVKRV